MINWSFSVLLMLPLLLKVAVQHDLGRHDEMVVLDEEGSTRLLLKSGKAR